MCRRWTRVLAVLVGLLLAWSTAPAGPASGAAAARRDGLSAAGDPVADSSWAAPASTPLPLTFDNAGISRDGDPGAADLDGAGRSLSARDLTAAGWTPGQPITVNRTRLTWPDTVPGRPDNTVADGQEVPAGGRRGDALTFLATATGARPGRSVEGTGQIVYRDGSRSLYTIEVPDWHTGRLSTKALALPHTNTPDGQAEAPVRLYARTVPVDPCRPVESVVLPRTSAPELHVFALSLRGSETGLTGTWAASTSGLTAVPGPEGVWRDLTLRLVVRSSAGGRLARIRLDNTFAERPVTVGRASIAVQSSGAVPSGTPVPLSFRGSRDIRIPAGAQAFSDPADFDVPPGTNLLVSVHLAEPVTALPVHARAGQTSYLSAAGTGDHTADTSAAAFTGTLRTWPFLTGVDVLGGPGSVVTLGDSITDGTGSTHGADRRWPDRLARRLLGQSQVPRFGVLNHGISANRVVTDRYQGDGVSTDTGGVSAVHRLARDVLAQTGAGTLIVFQGVNDVRTGQTSAAQIVTGLRAVAARARAHGLRVLVATIAPCRGWSDCSDAADARRRKVNAQLRGEDRTFDGVLDFDAVLRDPDDPRRLLPAYDSGDHLHPGDAGLAAVAESLDLALLRGRPPGAR